MWRFLIVAKELKSEVTKGMILAVLAWLLTELLLQGPTHRLLRVLEPWLGSIGSRAALVLVAFVVLTPILNWLSRRQRRKRAGARRASIWRSSGFLIIMVLASGLLTVMIVALFPVKGVVSVVAVAAVVIMVVAAVRRLPEP